MNPAPLPESEWLFNDETLPASQLLACCLWEYARESKTLLAATEFTIRSERGHVLMQRSPNASAAIERALALPSDQRTPIHNLLALFDGRPWLDHSPALRTELATLIPREVPPLRLAWREEVDALLQGNQAILEKSIRLLKKKGIPKSGFDEADTKLGPVTSIQPISLACTPGCGPPGDWLEGCSVIALTVDFAHYTDRELSAAFERMLKGCRPPHLSTPRRAGVLPTRKGHQLNQFPVALHRLAVARLVKHYGRASARFPEAARKLYSKRIYDRLNRELEQADAFFLKLFPSLAGERMFCRSRAKEPGGAP